MIVPWLVLDSNFYFNVKNLKKYFGTHNRLHFLKYFKLQWTGFTSPNDIVISPPQTERECTKKESTKRFPWLRQRTFKHETHLRGPRAVLQIWGDRVTDPLRGYLSTYLPHPTDQARPQQRQFGPCCGIVDSFTKQPIQAYNRSVYINIVTFTHISNGCS